MLHRIRTYRIFWTAGTGFHRGHVHIRAWTFSSEYDNETQWDSEKIKLKHKVVKLARSHLARCSGCMKFVIHDKDSKFDEDWREDEYEGWKTLP